MTSLSAIKTDVNTDGTEVNGLAEGNVGCMILTLVFCEIESSLFPVDGVGIKLDTREDSYFQQEDTERLLVI